MSDIQTMKFIGAIVLAIGAIIGAILMILPLPMWERIALLIFHISLCARNAWRATNEELSN